LSFVCFVKKPWTFCSGLFCFHDL